MNIPSQPELSWPVLRKKTLQQAEISIGKEAAAAVNSHLDRLETRDSLLNAAGDAILILQAPSGLITQANESACLLIGHSHDELQALTLFHLLDPIAAKPVRAFIAQQPVVEFKTFLSADILTRHNGLIPMELGLTLAVHRDNLHVVVIARDARERQRAARMEHGGMERLAHLMNRLGDAAIAADHLGRITFMNPLAREITEWTPAAALGRPLAEVFCILNENTGEPAPALDIGAALKNPDAALSGPVTIRRRNGGKCRLSAALSPIDDSTGRAAGVLIVFQDLTDLAMRDAVMRDVEHLPPGGPIAAIKWRNAENFPIEQLSANALAFLGMNPAEAAQNNMGFLDLVHPEDRARMAEEIRTYSRAHIASFEFKFRVLRADNLVRWAHAFFSAMPGNGPTAYNGYLLDITALAATENTLRDNEQKFRSLVEASTDAIFLAARDGAILECNATARRLFGYSRSQFSGLRMSDLPANESAAVLQAAANNMGDRGHFLVEIFCRRRNGETFPAEFSARKFQIKGNAHFALVIRDITARRKTENEARLLQEQVQQSQKIESLGLLASGIAHDFNNLLVGVLGNADLALAETPPAADLHGYLKSVKQAAQRAAELANQMLAYAGKTRFVGAPMDLRAIVLEMMRLLRASFSKKIKIVTRFPASLPLLRADTAQVRQVVMNLITNAADAIGDAQGTIAISAEAIVAGPSFFTDAYVQEGRLEGSYVCLKITDTGAGMDEATRKRIFDPFFTTKDTGRGLGLAVLLGILRAHRGAVKVESEPGKGTTFQIFLPAAEQSETLKSESEFPALKAWRGHGCIMIVDDEPTVCAVARRMIERMGFTVLVATNGRDAVGLFQREAASIVLVLMDMTMPDLDGEEVFRELIQIQPQIPVVLASGYAEDDILTRFRDCATKPAGFVHKPYAVANLKAALEKALKYAP